MNFDKSDYVRGLIHYCVLMVCICSFYKTPDGDSLFYKFLGLFGISPGISIGNNATLYIYSLVPLALAVYCIVGIFKYWYSYGLRFKKYNIFVRWLPIVIIIPVLLLSNFIYPSMIDRAYYAAISQRDGFRAVTHYVTDRYIRYEFTRTDRTFSYDFILTNHGKEAVEFNVKLSYENTDGIENDVVVLESSGELKSFVLQPKQSSRYNGEFTAYVHTTYESGSGDSIFSVVLFSDNEQYSPKPIEGDHYQKRYIRLK